MRILAGIFGVLAAATFGASAWMASAAGVMSWPLDAFGYALPTARLMMFVLVLALIGVLTMGLLGRRSSGRALSGLTGVFMWSALGLGALMTLVEVGISLSVAQRVHVTHFNVVAPSLSAGLLPLALGLLVVAVGAALMRRPA